MSQYDCISVGSATVDIILKSKSFKIVKDKNFETGSAICEMYGTKVDVDNFFSGSGGGATNTSCSLSNFGLKVSCVAGVGMDSFSEVVIDDLNRYFVDISNISFSKEHKTSLSVVLTADGGGRTALAYRSDCSALSLEKLKKVNFDTRWVYVSNLGSNCQNACDVIDYFKSKGIKIMWNPGSKELENIKVSVLDGVDIFSVNLEEAAVLSKKKMTEVKEILKYFVLHVKAKYSLITMGEKGAICISKDGIFHIGTIKVTVDNTIGAGDAFGSGFLYGIITNMSVEEALEYAIKNSVSVIQKTGAKEGFLTDISKLPTPRINKIK